MQRVSRVIHSALHEEVTAEGLRRYYRDHSRRFWPRLALIMLGSLTHGMLFAWWSAWPILFAGAAAELSEEHLARRVLRRSIAEDELARLRRRSLVQGLLYSAAFCAIIVLTWGHGMLWGGGIQGATFLSIILALGSVFDASFQYASNRLATLAKVTLYAVTIAACLAVEVAVEGWSPDHAVVAFSMAILAYMIVLFLLDVRGGRRVQARNAAALAERGAELERALADLTEKERAMRRFALAAEHANDSIVITGPDGRIEWVNGGFTARTGWTLADVDSRPSRLMADPDNDPADARCAQLRHRRAPPVPRAAARLVPRRALGVVRRQPHADLRRGRAVRALHLGRARHLRVEGARGGVGAPGGREGAGSRSSPSTRATRS